MPPLPERVPSRVVIEAVEPDIDGGRFLAKRTVGEELCVSADIFTDGHELLAAVVRHRLASAEEWREVAMSARGNDRWSARFPLTEPGRHEYTIEAWIDRFATWQRDLAKRVEAGQNVASELLEGAALVTETADRVGGSDGDWLRRQAAAMTTGDAAARVSAALDVALTTVMQRGVDRSSGLVLNRVFSVWVDRERARFAAWYECFPRSCADEPNKHGSLRDLEKRLPYVANMGFDVLYLPPIHPIGRAFRKGPNNSLNAGPDDPGSPWAIGGPEGGHRSIHPRLGTLEDFDHLLHSARQLGIEIALDLAFQCSPDHPYVREHPEWFRHRPDGTIKYAENPPKKYQDIYPLDFECADWRSLWAELIDVTLFWARRGVRIFRVDNPHTKPFRFWERLIADVRAEFPDVLFLSEAFTRPKVMKHLAKSGFTQSYTYFTWRNTRAEITSYFTELTRPPVADFMRGNLFVNTPDILPEYLQYGGRPAFHVRLVLAAALGASYGIYGPPFENFEATPVRPDTEEYRDSEKYQVRNWEWDKPNVFRELIARVNRIRRENRALHFDDRLRFYESDNDQILFFGKTTADLDNIVLVVANLDPHHAQSGNVRVPTGEFGLGPSEGYQVQDLLTGGHFLWHGEWNYVALEPDAAPCHILRLRKKVRTERDFDYFF